MQLAMIGLGKMGLNMAARLVGGCHEVTGYARSAESVKMAVDRGVAGVHSLSEVVSFLRPPRVIWLMLPAGEVTGDVIQDLAAQLTPGDTIVDGGNSNYRASMDRASMLESRGLRFLDVGTSGGIWGLTEGYSMMIGGRPEVVDQLRSIFETLAPGPERGWGRVGPSGAGHFVKMVHNGIEYGMMQAIAEGFSVMKAKQALGLDLAEIGRIWQHGSVVRSWLLELATKALAEDPGLTYVEPWVADSGEGRWTVAESIDLEVAAPVITLALQMRFASRDRENFAARMLAALREEFGGHSVRRSRE